MEAIKDYKRKQEELWIFFTALPKLPIGIRLKKDSDTGKLIEEKYDTSGIDDFNGLCRREFDGVLRQAEDLHSACIVDEIDLEDEIACADIKTVRKMVADYRKWPRIDPRQNRWLKSLFDAGIIDDMDFVAISNHIEFFADTMKYNVEVMKKLLAKYGEKQPKATKAARTWYLTDDQRLGIADIIHAGMATKRTKIDTLRRVFGFCQIHEIDIPKYDEFNAAFHFSNRSDYNNEVRKRNDKPFVKDPEFHGK